MIYIPSRKINISRKSRFGFGVGRQAETSDIQFLEKCQKKAYFRYPVHTTTCTLKMRIINENPPSGAKRSGSSGKPLPHSK